MAVIIPKLNFGGLHTRFPITKNKPDSALVAQNIKITGLGIEPIKGTKIFGNKISTAGQKILDAFTFIMQDGAERIVRIRETATENILELYDTVRKEWVTLLDGLTKGSTTSFVDYNTSATSAMYFGNGNENHSKWSGQKTNLTEELVGGETTIKVTDNTDFPASGTLIYNGTEIAYSAKPSTTTFTVVSAHASGSANAAVMEAVDDSSLSGLANSSIMISLANRVYMVDADDPNAIEYSSEGDAEDFVTGANRADAGIEDFPIVGGQITGLAAMQEYLVIFKARTVILFKWEYPTSTTKTPLYQHMLVADNVGAINHKGIASLYNEVYFTTKNGLKSLSRALNINAWNTHPLSDVMNHTIKDYDFTDAASIYYEKEDVYLVACKSKSSATNNDRVLALWHYQDEITGERRRGFSILTISASCFFISDNKLYYGSSADGNTYQLFTGTTFNGSPIISIYTSNPDDFGKKAMKHVSHYIVEGLIQSGTKITYKFIFDGGRIASHSAVLDSAGDYVSSKTLNTLGTFKLGEEVIGGLSGTVEKLSLFRAVIELPVKDFYDIQVERTSKSKGGDYRIYYEGVIDPEESFDSQPDI